MMLYKLYQQVHFLDTLKFEWDLSCFPVQIHCCRHICTLFLVSCMTNGIDHQLQRAVTTQWLECCWHIDVICPQEDHKILSIYKSLTLISLLGLVKLSFSQVQTKCKAYYYKVELTLLILHKVVNWVGLVNRQSVHFPQIYKDYWKYPSCELCDKLQQNSSKH